MVTNARTLAGLDPRIRPYAYGFVNALAEAGVPVTITSGRRSSLKQRQLWEKAQRGESGGLPALPPGRSLHEHGLAFDLVVTGIPRPRARGDPYADLYGALGAFWKQLGGEWGGDAPIGYDPVHFQMKRLR